MDEFEKLKQENEDLKTKLIDLTFEMNYNKEKELIEFVRDLYESLKIINLKSLSKEKIIRNLKVYIEQFAKNNKLNL